MGVGERGAAGAQALGGVRRRGAACLLCRCRCRGGARQRGARCCACCCARCCMSRWPPPSPDVGAGAQEQCLAIVRLARDDLQHLHRLGALDRICTRAAGGGGRLARCRLPARRASPARAHHSPAPRRRAPRRRRRAGPKPGAVGPASSASFLHRPPLSLSVMSRNVEPPSVDRHSLDFCVTANTNCGGGGRPGAAQAAASGRLACGRPASAARLAARALGVQCAATGARAIGSPCPPCRPTPAQAP